uniref:Uncharacterized protein n=1 Tax=Acrobeloides nanus TaxID=290746 RepID=A0A914EAE2_9BILA
MSSPNGYSLLNLCDIDQLQNPVYFPSPEDAERRRKHRSRRTPFSSQEQTSPPQQKLNERRTKKFSDFLVQHCSRSTSASFNLDF